MRLASEKARALRFETVVSVLLPEKIQVVVGRNGQTLVNGKPADFTDTERAFLLLLAQGNGQVRTPRMLLSGLYGDENVPMLKTFDVYACRIRSQLRALHEGAEAVVSNVWGRGYVFGPPKVGLAQIPPGFPKHGMRWTIARKSDLVLAVWQKHVTVEQVLGYYPDLSVEEFAEWQQLYEQYGETGLRTTRTKLFALERVAA